MIDKKEKSGAFHGEWKSFPIDLSCSNLLLKLLQQELKQGQLPQLLPQQERLPQLHSPQQADLDQLLQPLPPTPPQPKERATPSLILSERSPNAPTKSRVKNQPFSRFSCRKDVIRKSLVKDGSSHLFEVPRFWLFRWDFLFEHGWFM